MINRSLMLRTNYEKQAKDEYEIEDEKPLPISNKSRLASESTVPEEAM